MNNNDKLHWVPSKLELSALLLATATVLAALNYQQIGRLLLGEDGPQAINKETLPIIQYYILGVLSFITANAATFIFWLVTAYVGILILDTIRWFYHLYRSDIPQAGLANQSAAANSKHDVMVHIAVRSLALLGLVCWVVGLFVVVLPLCRTMFAEGLSLSLEIYKFPLACLLLSMYVYIAGLFLRFLTLRKHLTNW